MHPYNLADLETQLTEAGWSIDCAEQLADPETPGLMIVDQFSVTLQAPDGSRSVGQGDTRPDALRNAADLAGVLAPEQPHLM